MNSHEFYSDESVIVACIVWRGNVYGAKLDWMSSTSRRTGRTDHQFVVAYRCFAATDQPVTGDWRPIFLQ